MKDVSKATAQAIIEELGPIVKEVLTRHGLEAPKLKWSYGAWFELKATAAVLELGPHGVNMESKEASYYNSFGFSGLDAPIGTVFSAKGETYVFAGIAAKRPKYPIYALNISTNTYTFFQGGAVKIINAAALAGVGA